MTTETISMDGRARKVKNTFRMEYTVGILIEAKPERIWKLLTEAQDFPRWNSTVKSIEGRIAQGETIQLVAAIAPERVFRLQVAELTPNQRMVWSEGNAMFKGVRTFTLTPQSNGKTGFRMSEVYSGLMLPMIGGSLPDFGSAFEQYAADLKKEAEGS